MELDAVTGTDIVVARLTIMAEGDRARAVANVITTDDEYEQAGIVLRDVRKNKQAGLEEFDAIYEPLWEAVKALRKRKAEVIGPWEEAEQSLRDAMTEFHAARTARVETERLDAAEAAMAGIVEVTDPDEILERAATAKAELQKIQTPEKQPDGISYRDHWVAEVVNVRALALAVGAGEEDEDLINPNMKRLHELARALRTKFTIPGVIAKNRPVLQVRGR